MRICHRTRPPSCFSTCCSTTTALLIFVLLKILSIQLMLQDRLIRRHSFIQLLPTNSSKERVRLQLMHPPRPQSLLHITKQLHNEISSGIAQRRHRLRRESKVGPPIHNLSARGHGIVTVKGREPHHHLIRNRAHTPPITLHAVSLLHQHLWRYVVWSAHGGKSEFSTVLLPVTELFLGGEGGGGGQRAQCSSIIACR